MLLPFRLRADSMSHASEAGTAIRSDLDRIWYVSHRRASLDLDERHRGAPRLLEDLDPARAACCSQRPARPRGCDVPGGACHRHDLLVTG